MRRQRPIPVSVSLGIPSAIPTDLQPIAQEVDRIHESVLWSSQIQFEQMKLWRWLNVGFGVPAAALAAIAGGTGLADSTNAHTAGILALVAAGFGAALTTLNPSRRVSQAQAAGNAYLELQTDARQLLLIRLAKFSEDDAADALASLTARRNEINKTADPPSFYAYWRARRNITKQGRQTYEQDKKGPTS